MHSSLFAIAILAAAGVDARPCAAHSSIAAVPNLPTPTPIAGDNEGYPAPTPIDGDNEGYPAPNEPGSGPTSTALAGLPGLPTNIATPGLPVPELPTGKPTIPSLPDLSLPELGLPDLSLPELSLPELGLPELPSFESGHEIELPSLDLPSLEGELGLPVIDLPSLGLDIDIPSLTADLVGELHGSLPEIAIPALTIVIVEACTKIIGELEIELDIAGNAELLLQLQKAIAAVLVDLDASFVAAKIEAVIGGILVEASAGGSIAFELTAEIQAKIEAAIKLVLSECLVDSIVAKLSLAIEGVIYGAISISAELKAALQAKLLVIVKACLPSYSLDIEIVIGKLKLTIDASLKLIAGALIKISADATAHLKALLSVGAKVTGSLFGKLSFGEKPSYGDSY